MDNIRQTIKDALYDRERRLEEQLEMAQSEETRKQVRRQLDELQLTRSDLDGMNEDQLRKVQANLTQAD